ncbi:MAG: monofunctional biosynthetic peptidoglycan transglycosylase [Hyphomonadaceae bacterium]
MLEDKPDSPPQADAAPDNAGAIPNEPSSSGGGIGRWRAGMTAQGDPYNNAKPLWRRILVGVAKWSVIGIVGFLALSTLAVFAIGWTGPPPTLNMAGVAMSGTEVRSKWVDLKDMSPHLVRAVIATEDQNFCSHNGFDMKEIDKALAEAERGGRVRGASTISQQTAKNVFLWNGGGWFRKGLEAYFTVEVEWMWSKPRIMETYLNVAEWGDGIFGAEQAAQERFGVSARDLTPKQAAALAAVLPNPNRIRVDGPYATGRRNTQVQSLMAMVKRDKLDTCVVGP